MKGLSIEEKAKAYDDLLVKLQEAKEDNNVNDERYCCVIDDIVPELKESEDERIKKVLKEYFINSFQINGVAAICGVHIKDILAWLEKQGEQKPADKVEPMFHEGDWVIDKQGIVHQIANVIENVTNHTYSYDIVGGGYFNDNTEGVRLWTIQDAKDGDVLYCWIDGDEFILIYKGIKDGYITTYGHLYQKFKLFAKEPTTMFCRTIQGHFTPATKEQCDLLFQKMHEAGYEYDAEKKELIKIEQNPAEWSEEDDKILKSIIINIENLQFSEDMREKYHHIPNANKSYYQIKIDWLKSLKERYTWKPSDAQIQALEYQVHSTFEGSWQYKASKELLEQLKKL